MKYSIVTFGCRVDQADSLRLEEELRARGGVDAPSSEADLVIVNTCSVTATADQGARQTIRRIAPENPSAEIIATGCYATRRPDDLAELPGVVRVIRNDDKRELVGMTTASRFGDGEGACGAAIEPGVAGRTAFTLRVQTGCEERCSYCMLALMQRPYTFEHYRRLVDLIVERLPHASIGSDVIAGFPGETGEDFEANLAYLPASPLSHLHVFPYSDRPGTVASVLGGKVAGPVVRERGARLRAIGAELARRFRSAQTGAVRPGLTLDDGTLVVTDNYLKVRIPAGLTRNERVNVRIGPDIDAAVMPPA